MCGTGRAALPLHHSLSPIRFPGMTNFRDPAVIAADQLAVIKVWHAMAGIYLWEFVTTLDYEWSIIRRRQPWSWPTLIYSITRISSVMSIVFGLMNANAAGVHYNCEAMAVFTLLFGYLTFAAGSLLIVVRIIAIWGKMKSIIAISAAIWVTNVGFLIQDVVRVRSQWNGSFGSCVVLNVHIAKLNIIITLAADIALLLIMLVGLLRLNSHERTAFGMGRFLWRQGLIWLLIATIAEIPPTVFICLNLNDAFNIMFWITSLTALSIAATRIHRSLVDFASEGTHATSEPDSFRTSDRSTTKVHQSAIVFTPPNRVPVAIQMDYERYQTPPHSGSSHDGSFISADEKLRLGLEHDVEKAA
ncbi:hypothetical protein F5148DRAFT_887982 [Russula earlei]|uniref:Uncharacterized protein n=1 Tax=Russula earlei TaxID=71964 RepID=A0ACC0UA89_9AGAM|nr:hypothetical protein F5148DRAFT_887982 [Russula earlei]